MTKPTPFAPNWDEHRWRQIFKLEELLREIDTIDHGSGVLERLQRCIALAEELRETGLTTATESFTSFLKERALQEQA